MYLLDTDTRTHLHPGNPRILERMQVLQDRDVQTTIISKIELLRGRLDHALKAATGVELLRAQQWLFRTEQLLTQINIVALNQPAAEEFDRLRVVPACRKIGRADLLIASITLANRATLVTRNVKHFQQIHNLRIENWVD